MLMDFVYKWLENNLNLDENLIHKIMSIFTKIINREIPAEIVYEQDNLIVIKDIHPMAKIHLLIVPKKEIKSINDIDLSDRNILVDMIFTAKKLATDLKIENGYKLLINT